MEKKKGMEGRVLRKGKTDGRKKGGEKPG